ncbi:hypothetical protein V500_03724 [Pseudogymnoascus sp. VKM F-4518 (FW-2643)]|nr:hypothetical protein V500_03724 [Pseudogymnoascus sp. VKM F-4518 (FW-2643)]
MGLFSFLDRSRKRSVHSRRESSQESTDKIMNQGTQEPESTAAQKLTPEAGALLKVLSIFYCDGIAEKLLIEGARYVHLKAYPKTMLDYEKARDELLRHTFVGWNSEKTELGIHKLMQDVVRKKMDEEELHTLYDIGISLISAVWPLTTFETRNKVWRWPILEACLPHVTQLKEHYDVSYENRVERASTEAAILFNDAAWYQIERGCAEATISFVLLSQAIMKNTKDIKENPASKRRNSKIKGDSHQYAAIAAHLQGKGSVAMKECKHWMEVVVDRISQSGDLEDSTIEMGMLYNNTAVSHIMKKETDKAIQTWKLSYTAFQNAGTWQNLSTTWPAINLGIVYSQIGKPDEGEAILRPVLKAREAVLGQDDQTSSESGAAWRAMGHVLVAQGKHDEGLEFYQRALKNLTVTLGETHYQTADCKYNIANGLIRLGKNEEAIALLDQAIMTYKSSTWRNSSAARALWKKSRALQAMGNTTEAAEFVSQALRLLSYLYLPTNKLEKFVDEDWDTLVCSENST